MRPSGGCDTHYERSRWPRETRWSKCRAKWVITVLREEAANELGEQWMSDADHDHRPRHD